MVGSLTRVSQRPQIPGECSFKLLRAEAAAGKCIYNLAIFSSHTPSPRFFLSPCRGRGNILCSNEHFCCCFGFIFVPASFFDRANNRSFSLSHTHVY